MIPPPTIFLKIIRVSGSVLFVVGLVTFPICALQVYLGKIFKWGVATQGFYRLIRHPQYEIRSKFEIYVVAQCGRRALAFHD